MSCNYLQRYVRCRRQVVLGGGHVLDARRPVPGVRAQARLDVHADAAGRAAADADLRLLRRDGTTPLPAATPACRRHVSTSCVLPYIVSHVAKICMCVYSYMWLYSFSIK